MTKTTLSQFEIRERDRFMSHPQFLRRRIRKTLTGTEDMRVRAAFRNELEGIYGVPIHVKSTPFQGRLWTRTGWMFANPDWGKLIGWDPDPAAADAILAVYTHVKVGLAPPTTGELWVKSGLDARRFMCGLKHLRVSGRAYGMSTRQGGYIYVKVRPTKRSR